MHILFYSAASCGEAQKEDTIQNALIYNYQFEDDNTICTAAVV